MLSDYTVDSLDIRLPGISVSCIVVTKRPVGTSCDPTRKTTASTFCIYVGSRAVEYVQAKGFAGLKQTGDVVGTGFEVNDSISWSMKSPEYDQLFAPSHFRSYCRSPMRVEGDCIEPACGSETLAYNIDN